MNRIGCQAFLLACLIGMAGCSPPADGYSGPRGTVAGKLAVDGQPVPEGYHVTFIATRGSFVASGTVQQDGRYKLLYRVAQGLPVGDYVVQLGLPSDFAASTAGPSGGLQSMDVNEITKAWKAAMPFPQRYLATSTSGLKFTVQPGLNAADFELTKDSKTDVASPAL